MRTTKGWQVLFLTLLLLPRLCWEILPPNGPKRKTFQSVVFFLHWRPFPWWICQTINSWFKCCFSDRNSTAVCIYSIEAVEDIFEMSSFKGYNKDIPQPRPGTVKTRLAPAKMKDLLTLISSFCSCMPCIHWGLLPLISFVTWLWLRSGDMVPFYTVTVLTRQGFFFFFSSSVIVQGTEEKYGMACAVKILCRTIVSHYLHEQSVAKLHPGAGVVSPRFTAQVKCCCLGYI